MTTELTGKTITIALNGRIDSITAPALAIKVQKALKAAPDAGIQFDAKNLEYISSAGLRVIMRTFQHTKGNMSVVNTSLEVYEIFQTTGFINLMDVRKRMREVSVKGCPIIGKGAYGTVYRYDPDTVVKVYEIPDAMEIIQKEQSMAKTAFLMGIPTPISYDVVRVGDYYGSMFELVKARTLNELLIDRPERLDEILEIHVGVMRQVHATQMKPGELPDARKVYLEHLDVVRPLLSDAAASALRALLDAMPEDCHLIHGDFHLKNVMLSEDEPLLIDMETLSMGDPVFDFAGLLVAYQLFSEDDPENSMKFMGLPDEICISIWSGLLKRYLNDPDAAVLEQASDRIMAVGLLRFLFLLSARNVGGEALKQTRIAHTIQRLDALLPGIKSLALRDLME